MNDVKIGWGERNICPRGGNLPTKEAIEHGGYSALHFNAFTDNVGGDMYVSKTSEIINNLIKD